MYAGYKLYEDALVELIFSKEVSFNNREAQIRFILHMEYEFMGFLIVFDHGRVSSPASEQDYSLASSGKSFVVPDRSSDSQNTVVQSPAPSFSDENPVNSQFSGEDNVTEVIRRPPFSSPAESVSKALDFLARNLSLGKPASRQFSGGSTNFSRVRTPSPASNHHVEAKGDVGKKAVTNDTRRHPPPSLVESASTHSNSSAPRCSSKKSVSSQFFGCVGTPSSAPNHHGEAKGHVGKDAVTNDTRRHGSPSPVESGSTHLTLQRRASPVDLQISDVSEHHLRLRLITAKPNGTLERML
ncbi:uncharacterized protein LOC132289287 [Cornus florida]|uniref:uncharacterized protein LOC132289287 n=1 Tax=Cornus florida TaxID=4283 RepID=UPI00289F1837|nr:uncharacterized protein LOC132289287 [Cornus florida]